LNSERNFAEMRSLRIKRMRAIALASLLVGLAGCASAPDSGISLPATHHITELAIHENPASLMLIIKTGPLPSYKATRQTTPAGVLLSFADTDLQIAPKIYRPPDNTIINWIEAREMTAGGSTTSRLFVALKADRRYDLAQDTGGIRITFSKTAADSRNGQAVIPSTTHTAPIIAPSEKAAATAHPVILTWDPVPEASAYRVYWSDSPAIVKQRAKKKTVTTNRAEIPDLLPGQTYYFVVTSVKGSLESQPSAELAFTVDK